MQPLRTERLAADAAGIARGAELLRAGGLVAFPTETVYGLGADATNATAVARVFAAKGRPAFNPLIVHVGSLAEAQGIAVFSDPAERLASAFWPGPLTLVLPLRPGAGIAGLVTAGLDTVAVRVPEAPLAQALIAAAGVPVAAPSANRSGRVSPTRAAHIMAGLDGRIDAVVEGGVCAVGLESTIVAPGPPARLLRPGGLPAEAIEACLGTALAGARAGITAPGQLQSHYAPAGSLRLDATDAQPGEVLVGFGPVAGEVSLSESGDLTEAAARLFDVLQDLDRRGVARIAVAPIPHSGLGRAINDRLARAAAPRG